MKSFIFVPFFLYACGSDTPSFIEKPESIITLNVSPDEDTAADETSTLSTVDGLETVFSAEAEADAVAANGTSTKAGGTSDDGGSDNESDDTSVAKACGPYLKNFAQKMKIVDGDRSHSKLAIAPDTAIAIKLTGNQSALTLHLPASNDIPGICFFVTGHKAQLKFSSASQIQAFAYIGRGDQSAASVVFLGGSPSAAHVDLKGNHPTLSIQGLDPDLCVQEHVECRP